ncbi:MAG TPA: hypothetical protein VNG53_04075 [Bacteroidia bacterium]|nr:hypothetical protein [Bacteroidia bacterium]
MQSFAQDIAYIKTFPGNNNTTYFTNSRKVHGLTFYHAIAADTLNAVFYIENYKYSDIKIFKEKMKAMKAKLCMPGYRSKPGDFIFTMDSEVDIIFYYHVRKEDLLDPKFD